MRLSINQPCYLPWLGYFDRVARSDLHVVLDHVQFEKNSFTNRNKIRTAQGWTWLTVPLRTSGKFGALPIDKVEIANGDWRRKHWDSIRFAYAKAPFFLAYADALQQLFSREWSQINPLLREFTRWQFEAMGITTPILFSSEMTVAGAKADLILDICRQLKADTYISGPLGRNYLARDGFDRAGVDVVFHDYRHPEYRQAHSGFEPYMAALDLLLTHGPDSLRLLSEGQGWSERWD